MPRPVRITRPPLLVLVPKGLTVRIPTPVGQDLWGMEFLFSSLKMFRMTHIFQFLCRNQIWPTPRPAASICWGGTALAFLATGSPAVPQAGPAAHLTGWAWIGGPQTVCRGTLGHRSKLTANNYGYSKIKYKCKAMRHKYLLFEPHCFIKKAVRYFFWSREGKHGKVLRTGKAP